MTQTEDTLQTKSSESPSPQEGFSGQIPSVTASPSIDDREEEQEKYSTEESREYDSNYMDTLPGLWGRPPMYSTPEELQKAIEQYFMFWIKKKKVLITRWSNRYIELIEVPTITGLTYFLGFASRQSFYDYAEKEEFSYTIERASTFIEKHYEEMLQTWNTAGAVFALKNFKWKDKTEVDNNVRMSPLDTLLKNIDGKSDSIQWAPTEAQWS